VIGYNRGGGIMEKRQKAKEKNLPSREWYSAYSR
jgi:hypothetical protein